jgi:hypothetical protein
MGRFRVASLFAVGAGASLSVSVGLGACSSFTSDEQPLADASTQDDGAAPDGVSADASADSTVASSTYRDVVLADQPLAYWRMGITSGLTIPDESGHGNDLFLQGKTGSFDYGVEGAVAGNDTAIRFDGREGRATAKNPRAFDFPGKAPFTVELWAKRDELDGGHFFQHMITHMQGVAGNRTGFVMYVVPSGAGGVAMSTAFEYDAYDGGDQNVLGDFVPAGQWAHYAAVIENDTLTLYVNGSSRGPKQLGHELTASTADLVVAGATATGNEYPGAIDEIAIYDRALPIDRMIAHRMLGRP